MHPLAIAGIVAGGLIICWGGYQAIHTLYEWHNDRKEEREYEEYVRMHAEKGRFSGVPVYEDHDDTDNEDNEPLGVWKGRRDSINSQNELRHRNVSSLHDEKSIQSPASHELYEIRRSISERKSFLERENQILQKEEAELERRRSLLQSRGNSITGVFNDDSDNEQHNPFADSFIDQQQRSNSQRSSTTGSIFGQNPFADTVIEQLRDTSNKSSALSPDEGNNEQQQQDHHPLQQPIAYSSSDLDGSWSDLNEDMLDESPDGKNHYRADSNESFEQINKH